jgi:limonene-1,2-epoxide hydrolase
MAGGEIHVAREFIEALNAGDLDGFLATLDPEVELHTNRGLETGLDGARRWALKRFDHLVRHLDVEELIEVGGRVVALLRAELYWREDGELAETSEPGWLFEVRAGKVARWWPYEDRQQALAEAGIPTSRTP